MTDASEPQTRCLACHGEVDIKTISNFVYNLFKLRSNKSALYRIKINDVALVLGQIARHHLCGRDASGVR